MAVDIHEAGNDHHLQGVDFCIDRAGIALANMSDVRTSDHEIRVAEIDMGSGRFVPGDDPVAVPEEGRLGGNAGHLRLHEAGG